MSVTIQQNFFIMISHSIVLLTFVAASITTGEGLHFDLVNLNVSQILENVKNGVPCTKITDFFLRRIDLFDRTGPNLNAVIRKNNNASKEARSLDVLYNQTKKFKGLLHCVPVLVKDIIPVKGLPTTLGLQYFRSAISPRDAVVVRKLKKEGAIIIATANLKIFATSGFVDASQTGGLEKNPYAPAYTVYGSSSGNAAGQAARYAVIGLGTDSAGSVLGPASAANLLGFRPAVGMYSSEGVMPLNPHADTIAPLAFNSEDLGLVLDILTEQEVPFYRAFDHRPSSVQIGIITELIFGDFNVSSPGLEMKYSLEDEVAQITENAIFYFWKLGYQFHNASKDVPDRIQAAVDGFTRFYDCIPYHVDKYLSQKYMIDCSHNLSLPLVSTDGPIRSFQQLYDANKLPDRYQELFGQILESRHLCHQSNYSYMYARCQLREFFDDLFAKSDILIFPSGQNVPWRNNETRWDLAHYLFLPAFLDYPALSLPIGFSYARPDAPQGLPLSLILLSKPENVKLMLQVAHDFEENFGTQMMPAYACISSDASNEFGVLLVGFCVSGYLYFITVFH